MVYMDYLLHWLTSAGISSDVEQICEITDKSGIYAAITRMQPWLG
nr:hypothetical protein [Vibrio cholerae]